MAVFVQISFGASEARECHGFSVREIRFVFFQRGGHVVSSIFVLEGITLPKPSLSSLVSMSLPSQSYLFIYSTFTEYITYKYDK